jgi:GT2 family glycosyltransferase
MRLHDQVGLFDAEGSAITASVVVATLNRPDVLEVCLAHLVRLTVPATEILVVDSSTDSQSKAVVGRFPGVGYVRNDSGFGTLPLSRRLGVEHTSGEIVAFIDDDAFADPEWLVELCREYGPKVGGVGGMARNGIPGEASCAVDSIGKLLPSGRLTGNFAADPGKSIRVDHLIGCNMSFRRAALVESGGIPDWRAGISSVREDLFVCLRVRRAGYELRFSPRAAVTHIGAPQVKGRRFDARYEFATARNHVFVLACVYGIWSAITWRAVGSLVLDGSRQCARTTAGAISRSVASVSGIAIGLLRAARWRERPERVQSE